MDLVRTATAATAGSSSLPRADCHWLEETRCAPVAMGECGFNLFEPFYDFHPTWVDNSNCLLSFWCVQTTIPSLLDTFFRGHVIVGVKERPRLGWILAVLRGFTADKVWPRANWIHLAMAQGCVTKLYEKIGARNSTNTWSWIYIIRCSHYDVVVCPINIGSNVPP